MPDRKRPDPKPAILRERRTLNLRPQAVTDELFRQSEFFDARDLLQVKYEMIRRVHVDDASITDTANAFGFSRPSFYQAQEAFTRGGLTGLLPHKRGPREGHKLDGEVMAFIAERRAADPALTASALCSLVKERYGLEIHPRSIERALLRQKKNGGDFCGLRTSRIDTRPRSRL